MEVAGRQTASAPSDVDVVDAFDVPAATVSRLQETDPHIAYTGTAVVPDWTAFDMSRAWSGGTATTSKQPGAQATISFTGTGISRSEEHTSELQSLRHIVCRLLLAQ